MTWIATYTGRKVDLVDPQPDMISINDIATALSRMPRFAGHTLEFYSVAQHSRLVAWQCPHDLRLAGLLHDASEAYLCDLPLPIKETLTEYRVAEHRLMSVIADKFGFEWPVPREVKAADLVLLETEHRDLMPQSPAWDRSFAAPIPGFEIEPWTMGVARSRFIELALQYSDVARREYEATTTAAR